MAREILGEFGPERSIEGNRASGGGRQTPRDVMGYSPPQGPKHITQTGVGLQGGDNCGNTGSQGYYGEIHKETSGSPGLHGRNIGNKGTQR